MPAKRHDLPSEIDALFQLPLSEFTSSRNALAARLKKEGRADEAEQVRALVKPAAPAWAVNQLFWADQKAFDRLQAVADRVRKAQTGHSRNAALGVLLAEKKRITTELLQRAEAMLRKGGSAASADAMRRVSATLESLAVWGNVEGGPRAGRLTTDLDPPGFEALAAFMSGRKIDTAKVLAFRPAKAKPAAEDAKAVRARAREAVQEAESASRDARRDLERADRALTRADQRLSAISKEKEEIEARYAEAREEARAAAAEARRASQQLADAEKALARAREGSE